MPRREGHHISYSGKHESTTYNPLLCILSRPQSQRRDHSGRQSHLVGCCSFTNNKPARNCSHAGLPNAPGWAATPANRIWPVSVSLSLSLSPLLSSLLLQLASSFRLCSIHLLWHSLVLFLDIIHLSYILRLGLVSIVYDLTAKIHTIIRPTTITSTLLGRRCDGPSALIRFYITPTIRLVRRELILAQFGQ